ncbi:universal stress protein [Natribaculum luteum]|uniref:Universal stress protein n=1 Tax=Natribaculum luteum TaxID=1586232 RepID=A0ABD5P2S8_9EURY|nr:universal stress protein [Natribaculum luteum]
MIDHVLVPVDGSEQSNAALVYAVELVSDATITLLHVVDPVSEMDDLSTTDGQYTAAQRQTAEQVFEHARARLDDEDVTIETAIETGAPWREIVDYAAGHDVDHVVMGSHGRDGATRLLLGSVAEVVVRRSPVPVTVVSQESVPKADR